MSSDSDSDSDSNSDSDDDANVLVTAPFTCHARDAFADALDVGRASACVLASSSRCIGRELDAIADRYRVSEFNAFARESFPRSTTPVQTTEKQSPWDLA